MLVAVVVNLFGCNARTCTSGDEMWVGWAALSRILRGRPSSECGLARMTCLLLRQGTSVDFQVKVMEG